MRTAQKFPDVFDLHGGVLYQNSCFQLFDWQTIATCSRSTNRLLSAEVKTRESNIKTSSTITAVYTSYGNKNPDIIVEIKQNIIY